MAAGTIWLRSVVRNRAVKCSRSQKLLGSIDNSRFYKFFGEKETHSCMHGNKCKCIHIQFFFSTQRLRCLYMYITWYFMSFSTFAHAWLPNSVFFFRKSDPEYLKIQRRIHIWNENLIKPLQILHAFEGTTKWILNN